MFRTWARQKSKNSEGTLGESNALPASPFVPFLLEDNMKRISLTQGQFALVDDEDYKRVNQYKWYASYSPRTQSFYAARQIKGIVRRQRELPMAR